MGTDGTSGHFDNRKQDSRLLMMPSAKARRQLSSHSLASQHRPWSRHRHGPATATASPLKHGAARRKGWQPLFDALGRVLGLLGLPPLPALATAQTPRTPAHRHRPGCERRALTPMGPVPGALLAPRPSWAVEQPAEHRMGHGLVVGQINSVHVSACSPRLPAVLTPAMSVLLAGSSDRTWTTQTQQPPWPLR